MIPKLPELPNAEATPVDRVEVDAAEPAKVEGSRASETTRTGRLFPRWPPIRGVRGRDDR